MSYFTKCCNKPTMGIPPEVVIKRLQKQLSYLRVENNELKEQLSGLKESNDISNGGR